MRQIVIVLIVSIAAVLGINQIISAQSSRGGVEVEMRSSAEPTRLAIVWTSGDPDVAHRMTLMYTNASMKNGWFDEVELIVWGPSQRLLVGDKDIQAYIEKIRETGASVKACLACADSYGIAADLRDLGIEVIYMGKPLTNYLKSPDWQVISF